jgi:integrase
MSRLDEYIDAADRENTRKSYVSALRHFEVEWKGLLPATGDSIARYLADHAETLAINTLKNRLAAIARWHAEHGFPDPTRTPIVRQVFKGIRSIHSVPEKRARPLQLDLLQQVNDWIERGIALAQSQGDQIRLLRLARDRALLLLGFWRGFRADELVHLHIDHIEIIQGEGLVCYLPRSKVDRQFEGRTFRCPALSRLCPVSAYQSWITLSGLDKGPVFRKIDRWGHVADDGLAPNSLIPLLRGLFRAAGVENPDEFSSHSLRRGFAGWARSSGWDIKELMEYIGWRDIKSAMRYLDVPDSGLIARFEQGLPPIKSNPPTVYVAKEDVDAALQPSVPISIVRVSLLLTRFSKTVRGLTNAHRLIEQMCLEKYAMLRLDKAGNEYELNIPSPSRETLDETIYALLDDMYRIADDNQCFLEATIHEPATNSHWD